MKQKITIRDNYSNKMRDGVSSELRGQVEVQVRNTKDGTIESQQNHNLIVYGGREWLLRRIFGKMINDNDYAANSGIKWVGFGCGGGEPGNPLQTGTTVGSDNDLYQPVRIRFDADNNSVSQAGYYASRVLSNGAVVPGYYKRISNVTIKEDHANPYIENGVTKYPGLIAELRIELSADDCNGKNYEENGKLISYQDINEIALFVSDLDIDDPGKNSNYDEIYLDLSNIENKVFAHNGIVNDDVIKNDAANSYVWTTPISENYYVLQKQITNSDNTKSWITISNKSARIPQGFGLRIDQTRDENGNYIFTYPNLPQLADEWGSYNNGTELPSKTDLRIYSTGYFQIEFNNKLIQQGETTKPVYAELQYRNYYNEPWRVAKYSIATATQQAGDKVTTVFQPNSSNKIAATVACGDIYNPDINATTMFRVKETTNTQENIDILMMRVDSTSYDVKCYVSNEDIKKIKVGNFVYTTDDYSITTGNDSLNGNIIPQSAPLLVTDVYDPSIEHPETASADTAYFVIEKSDVINIDYVADLDHPLTAKTYEPSRDKPYIMFSRVCLSCIRKTSSREIVIIYKIYV